MKIPKYITALVKERSHLIFVIGFVVLGIFSIFFEFANVGTKKESGQAVPSESPDTIIPNGYVLVPIELANADSLGSIIDEFAVVDLYSGALPGEKGGTRVGQKLRLIRAPLNPKTFAVLVPEAEASKIVGSIGPVIAVVQNKNQKGLGKMDKKGSKQNHVQYYN